MFNIMTEMRTCGLREQLNLPPAYYEVAVKEAVGNIKTAWSGLKSKLRKLIADNENLSDEDRMYLWYVLKADSLCAAILNGQDHSLPKKIDDLPVDKNRLDNLLRRLTRKHLKNPLLEKRVSFP